jgi:hypothetical protein
MDALIRQERTGDLALIYGIEVFQSRHGLTEGRDFLSSIPHLQPVGLFLGSNRFLTHDLRRRLQGE